MNPIETTQLVTLLSRAGLMQALEGQSDVWAMALDDVRATDALTAARDMIRERRGADRWVTPGDVRDATRKLRERRLSECVIDEIPPAALDNDPRRAIAWVREYRHVRADGGTHAEADQHACHILNVPTERHITGSRTVPELSRLVKSPPTRDEPYTSPRAIPTTQAPDRASFLASIAEHGLDTNAYTLTEN